MSKDTNYSYCELACCGIATVAKVWLEHFYATIVNPKYVVSLSIQWIVCDLQPGSKISWKAHTKEWRLLQQHINAHAM